jgi:hypothetical protein
VGPADGLHQCRESGYLFLSLLPRGEAAKKRLVKGVFNWGNFPGADVWLSPALSLALFQCHSSGLGGWAAAVPEKLTSVFIITAHGRSSKRKRLVKGVLIVASAQGRRFGSAGSVFISAPVLRSGPGAWPAAARKFDICFYHYYPGAKQQKKSMVQGFFDFFNCPGAEVRICRSSRMGCTSAGKVDICFYHYCPGGEVAKKEPG